MVIIPKEATWIIYALVVVCLTSLTLIVAFKYQSMENIARSLWSKVELPKIPL